jgi:hypothetical protein
MIAKYPTNCCVCGEQFIPRETEIELHPTMRGPRNGKQYCHVDCMPRSNPLRDFGDPNGLEPSVRPWSQAKLLKGKGKFKQTAQSVQAQIRHQNLLEDIVQEGGLGGYEFALAGRAPTRKFKQVGNPRGRVRRNSGCGCGYGTDCGCGVYRSNPKGAEHRELMKLSRMGVVSEQAMRSAAADEAIAEYQAERASGGRGRRR